jgi:hypothetical protein
MRILILWAHFFRSRRSCTTVFDVQVAPKEADNIQSEKPLACINPRRQDVPNHLLWAVGTHAAQNVEFSSLQIPRGRACRLGPTLCTLTAPGPPPMHSDGSLLACWHAGMLLLSAPFSSPACLLSLVPSMSAAGPPPPLHLEHQRRDASVIPEPSIRTRSAIIFPSSDACCAESCNEAE